MDERLRRLARLQAEDSNYTPQYLRELMRAGYLRTEDVESAAYLGDVSALQLFPHPDIQSLTYQTNSLIDPRLDRIRQIEMVASMGAVIRRTLPPKLQEIMLRILESHYSDDRVAQTIALVRERLKNGRFSGSDEERADLERLFMDIRDQPFEWSPTEYMDQDHRRMVGDTLNDILEYDALTENDVSLLQMTAVIDLQSIVDLGGSYAQRIGYPELEGEQMTIDILRRRIVEVLLTPENVAGRRRNPDESIRQLEREYVANGSEATRRRLVAAYERAGMWESIYNILPKTNPMLEQPLPCGCGWGNRADEIPAQQIAAINIPQGVGVLARCFAHGELHALQADVPGIIEAYEAGLTRMYTFDFRHQTEAGMAGYYILGVQYHCTAVTLGPEHASHLEILPNGWLQLRLWFPEYMIHTSEAFVTPINENGVGQVEAAIDPDDIDWGLIMRHYVR